VKTLRVGDPHITVRNLAEAETLMNFIFTEAAHHKVDRIEFMGDLMHTHAVIRVEVMDFWKRAFQSLEYFDVVVLVGNHDQPGSREKEQEMNALNIFNSVSVRVVNKPRIIDSVAYIPYMSDHAAFLKAAQDLYDKGATKLLVAHQNFTVPLYSDMIDPDLVPQEAIITGHIHEQRQVGKVFQVGTPKWDTMTDANEEKGIWIYEHNEDGSVKSKLFISTKHVVTPIVKHTLNEGGEEVILSEKAKNYIELVGSTAWISQMKKKYKGLAAIKARPTDRKHGNMSKDGMFSITDYLDTVFKPIDGVSKEDIKSYLNEVSSV
jgi:DNA repair exonuclease SbcCD nuclease subunit